MQCRPSSGCSDRWREVTSRHATHAAELGPAVDDVAVVERAHVCRTLLFAAPVADDAVLTSVGAAPG